MAELVTPHKKKRKNIMAAALGCWWPILFGAAYKRNVGQSLLFKTMCEQQEGATALMIKLSTKVVLSLIKRIEALRVWTCFIRASSAP